jgi:hypothetical protein
MISPRGLAFPIRTLSKKALKRLLKCRALTSGFWLRYLLLSAKLRFRHCSIVSVGSHPRAKSGHIVSAALKVRKKVGHLVGMTRLHHRHQIVTCSGPVETAATDNTKIGFQRVLYLHCSAQFFFFFSTVFTIRNLHATSCSINCASASIRNSDSLNKTVNLPTLN